MFLKSNCAFQSLILTVNIGLVFPPVVWSNENNERDVPSESRERSSQAALIYRNPQERREAGLGIEIADWLRVSALFEVEREHFKEYFSDSLDVTSRGPLVSTVQLSFAAEITDFLQAELVLEAESAEHTHGKVDEALVSLDLDRWEITAGRLFPPFGEYYSYFVVGPLLEFGETNSDALVVDYSVSENFEISAFVLQSDVDRLSGDGGIDWGLAFAWKNKDESVRAGGSYLSDLAESDEGFVRDHGNRYRQRVAGLSAYASIGWGQYELTAEMVQALDSFAELDPEIDKPAAYNVELAYFPSNNLLLAVRYEHSREFEGAPKDQYGLSITWLPVDQVTVSLDYLRGTFKAGFVTDDDGNVLRKRDLIAWRLSVAF